MKATYDAEADAAYVEIVPHTGPVHGTQSINDALMLDWCDGCVVGIELLNPRPRPMLAAIAAEHGFAHLLDDIYRALDTALGVQMSGGTLKHVAVNA